MNNGKYFGSTSLHFRLIEQINMMPVCLYCVFQIEFQSGTGDLGLSRQSKMSWNSDSSFLAVRVRFIDPKGKASAGRMDG